MKIATWNVNSINARLPLVLKWLEAAQPEVLCLQETKSLDAKFPHDEFVNRGYEVETFGQPTYNGVAIISRFACRDVQRGFPDDDTEAPARLIAATVAGVRVVNLYFPNGQAVDSDKYAFKLNWMKRLRNFLDANFDKSSQVLLCGDFNVAPEDRDVHDPKAWAGRVLVSEAERIALEEIRAWGLIDLFRLHHQEEKQFSWWDYRAMAFRRNWGLRIDHIWVTPSLAARCKSIVIDKEPRRWERPSDHTPVIAEFA
jgi:exodeoxyribonuclease-3